jgi:hypothetical protein
MIITLTGRPREPPPSCEKASSSSALAGPEVTAAHAASAMTERAPNVRVSIVIFILLVMQFGRVPPSSRKKYRCEEIIFHDMKRRLSDSRKDLRESRAQKRHG